jgi:hypothetical protein
MGKLRIGERAKNNNFSVVPQTEYIYVDRLVPVMTETVSHSAPETVYVDREIIKEVPVEKVITVYQDVPRDVIKEVQIIKEVPVYTEKYVDREIVKQVMQVPRWAYLVMGFEAFIILGFIFRSL